MRRSLYCAEDSHCQSGTCNAFTHKCNVDDISPYNDLLVDCIRDTAPSFLIGHLIPDYFTMSKTRQSDAIKEKYITDGCVPLGTWNASAYHSYTLGLMCDGTCRGKKTGIVRGERNVPKWR
jgi:hypothetical protein